MYKPLDDCNQCEHYNKPTCPLSALSQKLKALFCPFLKLKIYTEDHKADLLASRLATRLDIIQGTEPRPHKEMDYNRNDTEYLARKFKPNIN
jgi:hypothetical protein